MDFKLAEASIEVDDNHILLGKPIELFKPSIDKSGMPNWNKKKKFVIRQVNWVKEWDDFTRNLFIFISHYDQVIENSTLPDNLDDLSKFRDNIRTALSNNSIIGKQESNNAFKAMCNICKFANDDVKWMEKNFTIDDYIEVFMYVYLYNVTGKKKGLKDVFDHLGVAQSNWHRPKGNSTSSLKRNSA